MKLWQLLIIIDSSHFTICMKCFREIDFRNNKHVPNGNGYFRHEVCPPRIIFYT